jgi:alkanesulfonate monooxygenase SsuD/methylene tetrahydromethanopterin reductase-like flavin-dependent oxidoreductase (luciferase family)
MQSSVCIAPTHERAEAELAPFLAARGIDLATAKSRFILGDPDEVGEQLASVLDLGVDGFTCNMMANGHDPDRVALLGETAAKLVT